MTITAVGVDTLRSVEGEHYGALTDSWAANSSQSDKGRFVVSIIGKYNRQVKLFVPSPYTDTISGIVTENGVPKARRVALLRRSDMELVRLTVSDPSTGAYSFGNVDAAALYVPVALDDDIAPDFNALVFDRV